ncbi:hypothetical protein GN956_G15130 [Arapaima gigas]
MFLIGERCTVCITNSRPRQFAPETPRCGVRAFLKGRKMLKKWSSTEVPERTSAAPPTCSPAMRRRTGRAPQATCF